METYLILPVISFLANFFTMTYAVALDVRNPVNRSYVIFAAAISLWVLCSAAFHVRIDDAAIVPFSKFSSIFWYATGFLFTNFTYVFLRRRRDFFYYVTAGASMLATAIAMTTNLIIAGSAQYPWGWRFREGVLFAPAALLVIVVPIFVSWALTYFHRRSSNDPVRRRQLSPLLLGVLIAIIFAGVNQFILPHLPGLENSIRYTASWSVILSIFVFYAIVRNRFLTPGINDIASELFASTREGVVILNSTGSVLHINPAAAKILNTEGAGASTLRLEALLAGYRTDTAYSNYQTTTASPGERKTVLVNQSDIRAGALTTGRIVIITDITGIARMNDALRESNELFTLIAGNVTDVIWIFDLEKLRFTYTSPSVTASTGYTPEEFRELTLSDLVAIDEMEQVISLLHDEVGNDDSRDRRRSRSLTLKERTKSGAMIDIEINTSFIRDTGGKPVAILGVTRDITEHKRLERELHASLGQLRERNEIMENDLRAAQLVQRALLPSEPPACDRLAIDFRHLPLEAVGGDFFNIQLLAEGGLAVFLGDVVGHGITAALFLSLLKSISGAHLRKHAHRPSEYLAAVNEDIYEHMHSYFMSAVYGIFTFGTDGKNVTMASSCAGHPPPIMNKAGMCAARYLDMKGSLMGVESRNFFPEMKISLGPGDRVFLYTDGLPEMINDRHECLGYERFLDIVGGTGTLRLGEALDAIIAEAHRFRGSAEIADDIVIIGFEVL